MSTNDRSLTPEQRAALQVHAAPWLATECLDRLAYATLCRSIHALAVDFEKDLRTWRPRHSASFLYHPCIDVVH